MQFDGLFPLLLLEQEVELLVHLLSVLYKLALTHQIESFMTLLYNRSDLLIVVVIHEVPYLGPL